MPSPFPGIDPFIEARRIWADFHLDLATEIRAHLHAHIQPGYYATRIDYGQPVPLPPLDPEQQAWAEYLLAAYR